MENTENSQYFPSYESFTSDLQNVADQHVPRVANSTMVSPNDEGHETGTVANPEPDHIKRRIIHIPLPFRCQECTKEFRKIEDFRAHLLRHLLGKKSETTTKMHSTSPYFCRHEGCKRYYPSKQERQDHEARHVSSNNFNCERIQKVFKYK